MIRLTLICSTFLLTLLPATLVQAEDGDRFRGPNADGVFADDVRLPMDWNRTKNVAWTADIPGWGWACPIAIGNKVIIATVVPDGDETAPKAGLYLGQGVRTPPHSNHHWVVLCYDVHSGDEIWSTEVHAGIPPVPRHPKSTYAAETPCTDGKRVYVLFGDIGLYALDLDGNESWKKEFAPQRTFLDYGAAASPVVHDGQVIVVYDNLGPSWIASFDSETGNENWRTDRDESHSWATPFVWKNDVRTEVVVPGKNKNRSYDLEGNVLWEFDGVMSNLVIPSPFAAHGMCYITSGYVGDDHRPVFAIRPGASGDLGNDFDPNASEYLAWYQPKAGPYNPTPIVYGNYYYTLYDRGFLTCHDARTGEEVYGKQRFNPAGSFTSSPWACNGHLFCISEQGLTYVVKAGPDFEIVRTCDLNELTLSTPSVFDGKLLIRTGSKLYCLTTTE